MTAQAKTRLIPAQILQDFVPQMRHKGRLQAGADADIIAFDPDQLDYRATFAAPARPAVNFRHVIVNGVPIIQDGQGQGDARPGAPVRRPVT